MEKPKVRSKHIHKKAGGQAATPGPRTTGRALADLIKAAAEAARRQQYKGARDILSKAEQTFSRGELAQKVHEAVGKALACIDREERLWRKALDLERQAFDKAAVHNFLQAYRLAAQAAALVNGMVFGSELTSSKARRLLEQATKWDRQTVPRTRLCGKQAKGKARRRKRATRKGPKRLVQMPAIRWTRAPKEGSSPEAQSATSKKLKRTGGLVNPKWRPLERRGLSSGGSGPWDYLPVED